MVRCAGHARSEGARETAPPDRSVEALLNGMNVGAATSEAPLTVEDRAAVLEAGEAQQRGLRGPFPAAAAASMRNVRGARRQEVSASPVGSAASGAGSRAASSGAAVGSPSASGTVSPAASASCCASSSASASAAAASS